MATSILFSLVLITVFWSGMLTQQYFIRRSCLSEDHCFSLFGSSPSGNFKSYEADSICQEHGQFLASIPDQTTQDLIVKLLDGMHQASDPYAWTSGQTSNDTTWRTVTGEIYTGQVFASDMESCGRLYQAENHIQLKADTCGQFAFPLCEIKRNGFCLYNEIAIPPLCYRILDANSPWYVAKRLCEEYDAKSSLAHTHIGDAAFQRLIQNDHNICAGTEVWVGINKRPWMWRTKECVKHGQLVTFNLWTNGDGNSGHVWAYPSCLAIHKTGLWSSMYSGRALDFFICEEGGPYASAPCSEESIQPLPTIPLYPESVMPTSPDISTTSREVRSTSPDNTITSEKLRPTSHDNTMISGEEPVGIYSAEQTLDSNAAANGAELVDVSNVALAQGSTCSASSELSSSTSCQKAMDGEFEVSSFAAAPDNGAGEWLKIMLPGLYHVVAIDLYQVCKTEGQCDRMEVSFSDGNSYLINRRCTGKSYWGCDPVPAERYLVPVMATTSLTSYVKLTCLSQCVNPVASYWYIQELMVWAHNTE